MAKGRQPATDLSRQAFFNLSYKRNLARFFYLFCVMEDRMDILKTEKTLISVLELKRLLVELRDKGQQVCFRYRLLGEMWVPNFMRVIQVADSNALFVDDQKNIVLAVSDIANIMQFELDHRFQNFHPHFHYNVHPTEIPNYR